LIEDKNQKKSFMIIGLNGWGNAGNISNFSIKYLVKKFNAKKIYELTHEKYLNYLLERPTIEINQGLVKSYISPKSEFFLYEGEKVNLLFFVGFEPHYNWSQFAQEILKMANKMKVLRIYTIGSYFTDVMYDENKSPISASTNNKGLIYELKKTNIELTNYNGPTSVYSEILWNAKDVGVDVISLWCSTPIYVDGLYPRGVKNILSKIFSLMEVSIDLSDLNDMINSFESKWDNSMKNLVRHRINQKQEEQHPSYIL
jgi:proteasome assembly chaperone (PAC2) family protein